MTTTIADYQRWRMTPGGRMHSLQYPSEADAIAEVQRTVSVSAIREFMDTREITYGRRPSVAEARAALETGWQRQGFAGTSADLQTVTQSAFPGEFVIRNLGKQLDDTVRTGRDVIGLHG